MFSRPERLKRHMEFRHSVPGDWKFKCPVCLRGCAGKKSFKSHMLRKHSLDGTIEELLNADPTPYMSLEKNRRKKTTEVKTTKMDAMVVMEQPQAPQEPQLQDITQQPQQQELQQQPLQQQQHTVQLCVDDNVSPSVAAIIQPQQTHQSFTIQNPQDQGGGSTIFLIPSNMSDKDQLMQNVVGFPQLVMSPSGTIQTHPVQNAQVAAATAPLQNQPVAATAIHNQIQNVTITGTNANLNAPSAGSAVAPVHTVLMTTHPAIQRPEATTAPVNLQQVATSSPVVQSQNAFSTIASYSGFVGNYDQY